MKTNIHEGTQHGYVVVYHSIDFMFNKPTIFVTMRILKEGYKQNDGHLSLIAVMIEPTPPGYY